MVKARISCVFSGIARVLLKIPFLNILGLDRINMGLSNLLW